MITLRTVASADLTGSELVVLRRLMDEAFEGDFSDDDWQHTLGGMHVVARDGDDVVAHAALVGRTLLAGELALDTGYVEGVATRPDRRRQGHAALVMQVVGRLVGERHQLGALGDGSGIPGFYERFGWERWLGPTFAATAAGDGARVRTADEDSVMVLRTAATPGSLDLTLPLTCDWRPGDLW